MHTGYNDLYIIHADTVQPYQNAYFGEGFGPFHLDFVNCGGTESYLYSCSRSYSYGIGDHTCTRGQEAGVRCGPKGI